MNNNQFKLLNLSLYTNIQLHLINTFFLYEWDLTLHFNIDDDIYMFLLLMPTILKTNSFPTGFALQYIF